MDLFSNGVCLLVCDTFTQKTTEIQYLPWEIPYKKSSRVFAFYLQQLDECGGGTRILSLPITWWGKGSVVLCPWHMQQPILDPAAASHAAHERKGGACRFTLTSQRDFATNVDRLQTYRYTFALECDRQYVGRNGRVGHAEGGVCEFQ